MGEAAARARAQGRRPIALHPLNLAAWALVTTCAFALFWSRRAARPALAVCAAVACAPFWLYALRVAHTDALIAWIGASEAACIVGMVALVRLQTPRLLPGIAAVLAICASGLAFLLIDPVQTRREAKALVPWLPDDAREIRIDEKLVSFDTNAQSFPCAPKGRPPSCAIDGCTTLTILKEGPRLRAVVGTADCH